MNPIKPSSPKHIPSHDPQPDKTAEVNDQAASAAKETERQHEREFYIKYIMETKGVSREVAEAQADFFS